MKIACEKCNKIMDSFFKTYKLIKIDKEDSALCKECYDKLLNWMHEEELDEDEVEE